MGVVPGRLGLGSSLMDLKSIIAKAKGFASKNPDKVRQGIDKAEAVVNEKTGNKYADQVKKGADAVEDQLGVNDTPNNTPTAPNGTSGGTGTGEAPSQPTPPTGPQAPTQQG